MTNQCIFPVTVRILATVPVDRLQKTVNALADTSLTVTLTRQTETEIRALVKNHSDKEYGVTLTATDAFCSCADALYRGAICKHATVVALSVLRHSAIPSQNSTPQHLVQLGTRVQHVRDPRKYGKVVCISAGVISVRWDTGGAGPCKLSELIPLTEG